MGKEYRYKRRKMSLWLCYLYPIFGFLFGVMPIVLWAIDAPASLSAASTLEAIGAVAIVTVVALIAIPLYAVPWYVSYCMKSASISLVGDSIQYRRGKIHKEIRFADISRFRWSALPSGIGWHRIIAKDTTIWFTDAVEPSAEFLWELKGALDREGRSDLYNQSTLLRRLKSNAIADQKDETFLKQTLEVFFLVSLSGVTGLVFASLGRFSVEAKIIWVVASLFCPAVVYAFADSFLMRPVRKVMRSDVLAFPLWNFVRQRSIYRRGFAVGTITYLIVASSVLAVQLSDQSVLWERDMEKGWKAFQYERYDDAEALFLEAIERTGEFESDDSRLADSLHNLGLVYKAQGMEQEAELAFNRSLAVLRERGPSKARAESAGAKYAGAGGEE